MKLILAANQEITFIELFAGLNDIVQSEPCTIKINSITGDISLQADDFLGETIDAELSSPQEIEIVEMDMFSFSSENGCNVEYTIWQFGKEITQ